jgi:hypothetical protein
MLSVSEMKYKIIPISNQTLWNYLNLQSSKYRVPQILKNARDLVHRPFLLSTGSWFTFGIWKSPIVVSASFSCHNLSIKVQLIKCDWIIWLIEALNLPIKSGFVKTQDDTHNLIVEM